MKFVIAAIAALGLAGSGAVALAACDDGETVVKFSHVVAAKGHPKGEAAERLAQRVNDEMNGFLCMEVYPNSTLYDDDKVMEALILGDVQLAAPSLAKFEAYTKKYRLFDLPFLFQDLGAVEMEVAHADTSLINGSSASTTASAKPRKAAWPARGMQV